MISRSSFCTYGLLQDVAKRAADRVSAKLEAVRGTGKPFELAEEFRVMTLQVRPRVPPPPPETGSRIPPPNFRNM